MNLFRRSGIEGECSAPLRAFGRCSDAPLIHDIDQISSEPLEQDHLVRVRNAKVACANYRAILHDFPHVFGAEARRRNPLPGCDSCADADRLCTRAVNAWLIRNAAFISKQQALPNAVNSPIPVDPGTTRPAYRPPVYGRAAVVPVDTPAGAGEAGYLDLKGVGVAPDKLPSNLPHSNGLDYLGNALVDFFYGWLTDTIFARTCPGYHVVPVYAVLDLGFDILGGGYGAAPAGMHVRRAHSRPFPLLPLSGSDYEKLTFHVELLLRYFGLTTSGFASAYELSGGEADPKLHCFGRPIAIETDAERRKAAHIIDAIRASGATRLDVLNVQSTNEGDWDAKTLEIYDFGQLKAERNFTSPLANPVRDGALRIGRIIAPTQSSFVQPNPRVAVDPDLCSRESANAYGFHAATRFRHAPRQFDQRKVETWLRLARLKALGRDMDWARRQAGRA
jgi:hypothetical protein